MSILFWLMGGWLAAVAVLVGAYGRPLARRWREPVLADPVLIVESDDWGAGPEIQVEALERLRACLLRHRDAEGRPAVMTLALVLALPDGPAIAAEGRYRRRHLGESAYGALRQVLLQGARDGVFGLQLHGLEHYWPATLMASTDPAVERWLRADAPQLTEELPSHLQSRWTDARRLPSHPLTDAAIAAAVAEETALYQAVLGMPARVAVPPTFVWDERVEQAWHAAGIQVVVTPGVRNRCRDGQGRPGCQEGPFLNGEVGAGVRYLVRDDYFEPEKGHRPEGALAALTRKWRQGRPCLFETHRSNFIGAQADEALAALDALFEKALEEHPRLRFLSTEALAQGIQDKDPKLLVASFPRRLACWVERIGEVPRFGRLARGLGLLPLLRLVSRPWAR